MERPTIIIDGEKCKLSVQLKGKHWRILGEFKPDFNKADYIEKHAEFIANFYPVSANDILDKMPLEDILPATYAIRDYMVKLLGEKIAVIEKNSEGDKAQ